MSDDWDAKARELANYPKYKWRPTDMEFEATPCLSPMIAAALRSAYEKGVEDSAGVAEFWVGGEAASRIRALKGEGR